MNKVINMIASFFFFFISSRMCSLCKYVETSIELERLSCGVWERMYLEIRSPSRTENHYSKLTFILRGNYCSFLWLFDTPISHMNSSVFWSNTLLLLFMEKAILQVLHFVFLDFAKGWFLQSRIITLTGFVPQTYK